MTDLPRIEIDCPKCGNHFALDDVYTLKIEDKYKKEFEAKQSELLGKQKELKIKEEALLKDKESLNDEVKRCVAKEKEQIFSQAKQKAKEDMSLELVDLQQQLKEKDQKLTEANKNELEVRRKIREVNEKEDALFKEKEALDEEVKKRVSKEKEQIFSQAKQKAKEDLTVELSDLQQQLKDKTEKLDKANEKELESIKRLREIEEREKTLELQIQRRVEEDAKKNNTATQQEYESKLKLIQKEHETKEESLKIKVEELSKKLEQGSQQTQGEIFELVLEDELKLLFPLDTIAPVPKGITGADLIQTVNNYQGKSCGTIIWEFKNTKNWTDSWVSKLKDDQRQIKADIGVILTSTLPKEIKSFGYIDGVWVTNIASYAGLCTAIRMSLAQIYSAKQANLGKNEKMEFIYQYLSGNEFKQRIQSIVEAFQSMKLDLEKEKVAVTKIWAKREKEIQRVIAGTTGMYGDLEGVIGSSLPKIEGIELDALPESTHQVIDEGNSD